MRDPGPEPPVRALSGMFLDRRGRFLDQQLLLVIIDARLDFMDLRRPGLGTGSESDGWRSETRRTWPSASSISRVVFEPGAPRAIVRRAFQRAHCGVAAEISRSASTSASTPAGRRSLERRSPDGSPRPGERGRRSSRQAFPRPSPRRSAEEDLAGSLAKMALPWPSWYAATNRAGSCGRRPHPCRWPPTSGAERSTPGQSASTTSKYG